MNQQVVNLSAKVLIKTTVITSCYRVMFGKAPFPSMHVLLREVRNFAMGKLYKSRRREQKLDQFSKDFKVQEKSQLVKAKKFLQSNFEWVKIKCSFVWKWIKYPLLKSKYHQSHELKRVEIEIKRSSFGSNELSVQ